MKFNCINVREQDKGAEMHLSFIRYAHCILFVLYHKL